MLDGILDLIDADDYAADDLRLEDEIGADDFINDESSYTEGDQIYEDDFASNDALGSAGTDDYCEASFDGCYEPSEISFKGNDEQYYVQKAKYASDQQLYHLERANKALKDGQKTVYKDHIRTAEIYEKRIRDFSERARIASKKSKEF